MQSKVLVVEDDTEINELLGEYLGLEGIGYESALNGKVGLEKAGHMPDAIILDVMLPDVDGYEICRRLGSHRATALIPIVMLTCMNQDCDCRKGLACGAFQYMSKPFLPDDLIQRIRDAFQWKQRVPQRPPAGQVEINTEDPRQALHGVNEMIADIYAHSNLPDPGVVQIRQAFGLLLDWASAWAAEKHRNPHLLVHYRLLAKGQVAAGVPADSLEWVISEVEPGLLANTLFAPAAPLTVGANPFSALWSEKPAVEAAKPSPLAPWFQFLAKCGVARFEKDSKIGQVKLSRSLLPEDVGAIPVVAIDGVRVPTRLRTEAAANKRR